MGPGKSENVDMDQGKSIRPCSHKHTGGSQLIDQDIRRLDWEKDSQN